MTADSSLLPLNHFGRSFVVDIQRQIFKSDGQIPTVYPPQFSGLEFTGKFVRVGGIAASGSIEVNRLMAVRA
jgi:hypothetical protein